MNKRSVRKLGASRSQIARVGLSTVLSLGALATASVAVLTLASSTATAQTNTSGYIYGQVTGPSSSGLTVEVVDEKTSLRRTVKTDSTGNYRFGFMPVGNYTVSLLKDGASVQDYEGVQVSIGSGSLVRFSLGEDGVIEMAKFEVSGNSISPIDVSQPQAVTIFRAETIEILPVARNLTAVALLAPGTTKGDADFGNLASFNGATVGENAFFINGFNVTNFRNGLGGGTVPFEFYDEFQVITGGYGAEFGRSTGGVINTVTKSGGNEWKAGMKVIYEPDSLSSVAPSSYSPAIGSADPVVFRNNREDYSELKNLNLWFSGAIIPNRLFIYAMYQARSVDNQNVSAGGGSFLDDQSSDPFWGAKLDFNITDNQKVEVTAFSDKRTTVRGLYGYDAETYEIGDYTGNNYLDRGGDNYIARYIGTFGDVFTLSALYGEGKASFTDRGEGDAYNYIIDSRGSGDALIGQATSLLPGQSNDERKAFRVDGTLNVWDHTMRFGFDQETNTSADVSQYSGDGRYWRYYNTTPGSELPNEGIVPAGVTQYVRERFYSNGGSFEVETSALYIEDSFKLLNDQLFFTVGLRNETFNNKNANEETFIEITDQLAPRVAVGYDPRGDGKSKIYGNWGRYFLPIASNTNIRLAGAEKFTEDFYALNGVNADDTPIKGAQIGDPTTYSNGSVKDARSIVNQDIEPMYQDEFILGYQTAIGDNWSMKIQGIYRDLKSTLEDVAIDAALLDYAAANGYDDFEAGGFDYYVLTNPGSDMRIFVNLDNDEDGDGIVDSSDQSIPANFEEIHLTSEQLNYPESVRKYYSLQLSLERLWDGKWMAQFGYSWGHSYGNNEGFVRSDNDQTDAGLTTLFDQPGLLDGGYGNLPNDRRHSFKAFGAYKLNDEWTISSNVLVQSGRPKNAFGIHPTDGFAAAYGSESFYRQGVLVPRGSLGYTDWTYNWDLGFTYKPKWGEDKLQFSIDIFNVLDFNNETEVYEIADEDDESPDPDFGLSTKWQTPRYVRFTASIEF